MKTKEVVEVIILFILFSVAFSSMIVLAKSFERANGISKIEFKERK